MINKKGVCYQCAELNDYLQEVPDSTEKIKHTGLSSHNSSESNLDIRLELIKNIDPLNSNGSDVEDTIMQILRLAIDDR
jgi:hypothetical protein